MGVFRDLLNGYRAGDARRPGRDLVPSNNNRAMVPYRAPQSWVEPAHYQPGPRLIRRRLSSPQVRIDTAHGTFWFKDYCEESEWSE
jgi:hypothetical protein